VSGARRVRGLIAAAALLASLLLGAPSAAAVPRTSAEAGALARQAATDPAALEALRATTAIDGRPADLGAALAGARGPALTARLHALRAGLEAAGRAGTDTGGASADADAARAAAAGVLHGGAYRPDTQPKPFKGFFTRVGDWLQSVADFLDDRLPGGPAVPWTLLAVLALIASATGAALLARRIDLVREQQAISDAPGATERVADVERRAAEAEARGEHEAAVRLRFRAGLLRLHGARRIDLRASMTTGEIRRTLRSPAFDPLARTFDEIAYGRRPATAQDAGAARDGWPAVLAEGRR
jgi:hypothetical protein